VLEEDDAGFRFFPGLEKETAREFRPLFCCGGLSWSGKGDGMREVYRYRQKSWFGLD